jgi:hypothetical protein
MANLDEAESQTFNLAGVTASGTGAASADGARQRCAARRAGIGDREAGSLGQLATFQ